MKTITFESIRNLLRSKKKNVQDYGDASFKRSDSFRRISIRRSYLNRNRKRAQNAAAKVNGNNGHANVESCSHEIANSHADASISCPVQVHAQSHPHSHSANGGTTSKARVESAVVTAHHTHDNAIASNMSAIDEAAKIARCAKTTAMRKSHDDLANGKAHGHSRRTNRHQQHQLSDDDGSALPPYASHGGGGGDGTSNGIARATSIECFVKAGNRVKKPIEAGLNVASEQPTNANDHMKRSFEKSLNSLKFDGSFIDINLDTQSSIHSANTRCPNSYAPNDLNAPQRPFRSLNNDTSLKSKPRLDYHHHHQQKQQSQPMSYIDMSGNGMPPAAHKTHQTHGERPSFVIFKTFSNEHNSDECLYLETCFNNSKEHMAKTRDASIPIQIKACPNEQHITIDVSSSSGNAATSGGASGGAGPATSLDGALSMCHPTAIELHKKNHGVVIQISDAGCNIDSRLPLKKKGNDVHVASDDETSLNGKFTFEIYKQIRTAQKCEKPCTSRSRLTARSTEESDFRSCDSRDESTSYRHSMHDQTLSDSFRSLCIGKQMSDPNFFLEAPESPIPYPLRIKTNPFTNQAEPYSVNLGRVWKQLNLGQDETSLETSLNTQYNKPTTATASNAATPTTTTTTTAKPKNDSFRSISSHDSGFSLTLTKQKSLFQRSQPPPKKPQRKSKLSDKRDTNGKRMMGAANATPSMRRNKRRLIKTRSSNGSAMSSSHEHSSRRRSAKMPFAAIDVEETGGLGAAMFDRSHLLDTTNDSDISISQEISDLEMFFEEHLKRLKEYYLHKKKMTEQGDSTGRGGEVNGDDKIRMGRHMQPIDEKRRKRKKSSRNSTASRSSRSHMKPASIDSHRRSTDASKHSSRDSQRRQSTNRDSGQQAMGQFDFPRPDKRSTLNARHNGGAVCIINGQRFGGTVQYASLDFSNDQRFDSFNGCPKAGGPTGSQLSGPGGIYPNQSYCDKVHQSNTEQCDKCNGVDGVGNDSDDEYVDVPSDEDEDDDEYGAFNFDQAICVKCQQPLSECVCSEKPDMQRPLPTSAVPRCYMTPDNLLCNCMGTLHGAAMHAKKRKKPRKNKKTHKIYQTYVVHSLPKPAVVMRRKRRIRYLTKNHSLRRDYCYISSKLRSNTHIPTHIHLHTNHFALVHTLLL